MEITNQEDQFMVFHVADAGELSGQAVHDHLGDQSRRLSSNHLDALENYQCSSYEYNAPLRGELGESYRNDYHNDLLKHLDSSFNAVKPTTKPVVVMRGVKDAEKLFGDTGSMVGKTFHDPGYLSATTSQAQAKKFTGAASGAFEPHESALIHMHLNPGASVISPGKILRGSKYNEEKEGTINRGSSWTVRSDVQKPKWREIHLDQDTDIG